MRAFVCDTDLSMGLALAGFLTRGGVEAAHVTRDDLEALASASPESGMEYVAIILGGTEAEEIAAALRAAGVRNPILGIIDARSWERCVSLQGAGCDDVLYKPVKPQEVASRISAIVRRMNGHVGGHVAIGDLTVFFDGREPEIAGQPLKLSARETAIFTHLALKAGKVVAKDSIFNAVYGMQTKLPFDKVIDVYICKIRKKIEAVTGGPLYIETVYGRGYKLAAPEAQGDPEAADAGESHPALAA